MKTSCFLIIPLMRNRLLIVATMLLGQRALGQGTVSFSNLGLPNSLVYDARSVIALKAPVGTTFSLALYWAPVDPLNPNVAPDPFAFTQQGPSGNIGPSAGQYSVGIVTIAGVTPPGGPAWLQVRAWETACGGTFEQAYNRGETVLGVSSIIQIRTGDPTTGGSPAPLTGIGPIYLLGPIGPGVIDPCVPEPSTGLLVFLGAAAVCF